MSNRFVLIIAPAIVTAIVLVALLFFTTPVEWPPELTPPALALVSGYVLSWLFQKFPILKTFYDGLPGTDKSLVMVSSVVGVGGGLFAASVLAIAPPGLAVEASLAGAIQILIAVLSALISSQARYLSAVRPAKR